MKSLSRVVWSEGMYLGPHHFQAQSRYFEDSIHFATSALWPHSYGLVGCALDEAALTNGTVSIVHARGIFPDGLLFHMPESDPLPQARNIAELFPPTRDKVTVLLAVAAHKQDGLNCALAESHPADGHRYTSDTQILHDETTGRDEKPVRLGRKNIRLVLDMELRDDLVTLPIARIMRSGSGQFIFDPEYIPPCVQIGASGRLMNLLRRLIEIMEEKSTSLARSARGPGARGSDPNAGLSTRDIASFWFLHTVNASLSPLRHLYYSKRGHPEELFLALSRLGGALCTFALESHPRMLPVYDHDKPDESFETLDRHIRDHLELIIPTSCVSIALHKTADYFYAGQITDQRCVGRSTWIIGVRSGIGEVEMISRVPQLVKICSEKFVGELVKRALPGLGMAHLPVPPPAISTKVETQYFLVNKSGPFWDHIVETRRVGLYVPGEIPNPEIELLVVLES
jgi:type VI secretion system protein ImpJ